jgi:transcriptional regulator GlxA family with amidase domain
MRGRRWLARGVGGVLMVVCGAVAYLGWPSDEFAPYEYGRDQRERLPRMTLLNHERVMHDLFGDPALEVKTVGILVYDGVDTLEAIAPMVVFSELMGVQIQYVGLHKGLVSTRLIEVAVDTTIMEADSFDVLVVPGGTPAGVQAALRDTTLRDWLIRADSSARLTAGIGHGALLLAKAGLLDERRVALAWPEAQANAEALGVRHDDRRYVNDGRYWTSVGGTAAIDVSLAMLQAIAGPRYLQAAMLDLEYAPAPPLTGGHASTTPADLLGELMRQSYRESDLVLLDSGPLALQPPAGNAQLLVGVLVYEDFFTLDAIGPLVVLAQIEGVDVRLVRAGESEIVKSGRTRLHVPTSIKDIDALDVLLVPGGSSGTWAITGNREALDWIRRIDVGSRYTGSVCTGAWILGAAGLLEGRRATTNWYRAAQMMKHYGAEFVEQRYVVDGKYWTSAGVSAGIDLSFALIQDLRGEAAAQSAMMRLHYSPQPPLDAGTPAKTDDEVLDMMHQMYDYMMLPLIREAL